jgi:hypothetical protein
MIGVQCLYVGHCVQVHNESVRSAGRSCLLGLTHKVVAPGCPTARFHTRCDCDFFGTVDTEFMGSARVPYCEVPHAMRGSTRDAMATKL